MFEDSFTDIVGFGAPGAPGQLLKSFFNGLRRGLVGSLTHKRLSVKQNFPGRIELLQEIKIKNIAGQYGAAMLSSCGE